MKSEKNPNPQFEPILTTQLNRSSAPWYLGATSGLLASGVSLAIGELAGGLSSGSPTLVVGIGNATVRSKLVPKWFRDFGTQQAGSSQKPLLILGIVVTTLLLGIGLGLLLNKLGKAKSHNRYVQTLARFRFLLAAVVFSFFGLIAGLSLKDDPFASLNYAILTPFFAVSLGYLTLFSLINITENNWKSIARISSDDPLDNAKRNFILGAGATAIFATLGSVLGRQLINAGTVEQSREEVSALLDGSVKTFSLEGHQNFNNINGIAKFITPNDDFYLIDTVLGAKPVINHSTWTLKVTGMVDNELELSFDELLDMGLAEELVTLSCVSNQVGGQLVGNAIWRGVPLKRILDEAGVDPNQPTQVVGRSVDNWTAGFPTQLVYEPDRVSMVAVEMNGEPLPRRHGFPARLVVSGLYGYVSATKWLESIEITSLDFDPYWIPRGWSKEGPVKTQSRIDVPRSNRTLPAGQTAIAGVAWAPYRGISKVEVGLAENAGSGPGPISWFETELSSDISDNSWRQWHYAWDASPGTHEITVRATDGDGVVQTSETAPPAPNGSSGWHSIKVFIAS